jgi:hypothetical protein
MRWVAYLLMVAWGGLVVTVAVIAVFGAVRIISARRHPTTRR